MDYYGFYTGNEFEAYNYLGAHICENNTIFRVFAPNAQKISVIGDFNGWQETPMEKIFNGHFWECIVPDILEGSRYKYRIYKYDGKFIDHSDPYGFYSEVRPQTASIVYKLDNQNIFQDKNWIAKRTILKNQPMNIYEIHLGSWKRKTDNSLYSYKELADILIPYLKEYGYNFVELMPLSEHPCDESWGYQNTGFFSPTSRYGTPDELKFFINKCHLNNIGVIMDFVPVHFAIDDYALANFDGTALYEYPSEDIGISEWGSKNFMHSRGEVRSFLQSAAYYWLKEFHFDGLRIDAVSNLIYWQGNPERGINNTTLDFIKNMNKGLKERISNTILIAEDSSTYPKVTESVENEGLGFDYKWDLGWMNDTLNYFRTKPDNRSKEYHKLTFSMMYFYNESFLLPFSHDEVVHGKGTILQKMYGSPEDKFSQIRALYLYMMAHPGKKLNFMGNELAQSKEWNEKTQLNWEILNNNQNICFHIFIKELNRIYLNNPAFYANDYNKNGFQWIDCHQEDNLIYIFERKCKEQTLLFIFNFSNQKQNYNLNLLNIKKIQLIIDSDLKKFGGKTYIPKEFILLNNGKTKISLPPYSAQCYIEIE